MVLRVIGLAVGGAVVLGFLLAAYASVKSSRIEAEHPPTGRFVEVAGLRLHYVDLPATVPQADDAPAILFVHGASANLNDSLLAFRTSLEGRHRLIFVDRPGHGYSERGTNPGIAAPAAQAAVLAALLDRVGVRRAVVVGHSWGGAVAAAMGVLRPDRVAGLVFVAAATHPWPGGVEWYYRVAAQPIVGSLFARTLVMPIGMASRDAGLKGVFDPNPEPDGYTGKVAVDLLFRPPEFVANAEDVFGLNANLAIQSRRYGEIRVPTTILSGNKDSVVYEELHSGGLARDIPGSRLIWLDGVGHMPHHAAGERVVTAIEEVVDLARGRALASR